MIERILIAVGEEQMNARSVAEHVAEIADGVGAEVILFRAYTEEEFDEWLDEMGYDSAPPTELARRNSVVREAAEVLRDADVKLTVAAEVGPPAETVIDYVETHSVDHVVVGGRRRSPAGKALLGSVSQSILLGVDVPCTIMLSE